MLAFASIYFPKEDSNPHNQNQNLRCYHYTIGEWSLHLQCDSEYTGNKIKCQAGFLEKNAFFMFFSFTGAFCAYFAYFPFTLFLFLVK